MVGCDELVAMSSAKATPDQNMENDYNDLTEKQQRIVDARAENPDVQNAEIAEMSDANPSYTSKVLDEYDNLVEYRRDIKENQRETGEEKTTGDPFEGDLDEPEGVQTIKDRPNKAAPGEEAEAPQAETESTDAGVEMNERQQQVTSTEDTAELESQEDEATEPEETPTETPTATATADGDTITVEFSEATVRKFLKEGEVPDDLYDEFVDAVIDRAFE